MPSIDSLNSRKGKKSSRRIYKRTKPTPIYYNMDLIDFKPLELINFIVRCRKCGHKGWISVDPYGNIYYRDDVFWYDGTKRNVRNEIKGRAKGTKVMNKWLCDICKTEIIFIRNLKPVNTSSFNR